MKFISYYFTNGHVGGGLRLLIIVIRYKQSLERKKKEWFFFFYRLWIYRKLHTVRDKITKCIWFGKLGVLLAFTIHYK